MRNRRPSKRKTARATKSSTRTKRPSSRKRKKSTDAAGRDLAWLGLGSNLGDRAAHLEAALAQIGALTTVRKVSSFYRTEPVGFRDQPDFWNAVVEIEWSGTPSRLLDAVRRIERRVGRTRTFVNGPREIDVDILDFGGRVRDAPAPLLPHPRLVERRFALEPLAEIRPDWRDPRSGRTITDLLATIPARPRVRRIRRARSRGTGPRE